MTPTNPIEEIIQDFYMRYCHTVDGKIVFSLKEEGEDALTFLKKSLTSLYNKGVEAALGALPKAKPHFTTCEYHPTPGYQPVCDCGALDFNSALQNSRLSIQKLIIK